MDITVYVRHLYGCRYKRKRYWKKCDCPKWLYCSDWDPDRRSAGTRIWAKAVAMAQRMESGVVGKMSVQDAVKQFLADKEQQNIGASMLGKYKRDLVGLDGNLHALTLHDLEKFRATWEGAAITRAKKQERLRSFFHYCVKHKWISYNLAIDLSKIKVEDNPTLPLDQEEFRRVLGATEGEMRALVLLMRYSGLRISDAVSMPAARLADSCVFLYTQKTGTPVRVPVPEWAEKEIAPHLPLYRGGRKLKSCVTDFQERFAKLGIHSHQLRDTFAVGLLLQGVPIEDVAILLGHSDPKITWKKYAPWVKARQERLEASVRKTWLTS